MLVDGIPRGVNNSQCGSFEVDKCHIYHRYTSWLPFAAACSPCSSGFKLAGWLTVPFWLYVGWLTVLSLVRWLRPRCVSEERCGSGASGLTATCPAVQSRAAVPCHIFSSPRSRGRVLSGANRTSLSWDKAEIQLRQLHTCTHTKGAGGWLRAHHFTLQNCVAPWSPVSSPAQGSMLRGNHLLLQQGRLSRSLLGWEKPLTRHLTSKTR